MKVEKKCGQCGKVFFINSCHAARGEGKYCSRKCFGESNKKTKANKTCESCGAVFLVHQCYEKKGGGKYCSAKCYHSAQRKNRVIEYDGDTFYLNVSGYYRSEKTGRIYHRLLWQQKYGTIPDGCLVHHKDENKENNEVDNLIMVSASQHGKIHYHSVLEYNRNKPFNPCTIEGCNRKVNGHGLCAQHLQRARRIMRKGHTFGEAKILLLTISPYQRVRRQLC